MNKEESLLVASQVCALKGEYRAELAQINSYDCTKHNDCSELLRDIFAYKCENPRGCGDEEITYRCIKEDLTN